MCQRVAVCAVHLMSKAFKQGNGAIKAMIDFKHLLPHDGAATVEIWHDTADACGELCDLSLAFMKSMAEYEVSKEAASSSIYVQPRFIFQECTDSTRAHCDENCTPNGRCADKLLQSQFMMSAKSALHWRPGSFASGLLRSSHVVPHDEFRMHILRDTVTQSRAHQCLCRYCHLKDVYVASKGSIVAEEMIRETCLWDVLTNGNKEPESKQWWEYKLGWLTKCNTTANTYDENCSEEVCR